MPISEMLLKRIAKLIAMNYAISEDVVYQRVMETNSIDAVLQEFSTPTTKYGKQ